MEKAQLVEHLVALLGQHQPALVKIVRMLPEVIDAELAKLARARCLAESPRLRMVRRRRHARLREPPGARRSHAWQRRQERHSLPQMLQTTCGARIRPLSPLGLHSQPLSHAPAPEASVALGPLPSWYTAGWPPSPAHPSLADPTTQDTWHRRARCRSIPWPEIERSALYLRALFRVSQIL